MRRFLRSAPLFTCLFLSGTAHGQSAADKAAARALADDADVAFAGKNFAAALEKYQKALLLVPDALTLRLGLARAQAGMGRFLEATESYNLIVRTPLTASSPAPFRAAQKDAEREIAETATQIGSVIITLVPPAGTRPPTAFTVSIDDEPVPAALLGERRPANPGRHTVHFSAEGFRPAEAIVDVRKGATSPVPISLFAVSSAAPASSASAPTAATGPAEALPAAPAAHPNRSAAYVAFGLGAAGIVVGSVAGTVAISKHGKLTDACIGGCPPGTQGDIDGYRAAGAVSTIGFVAGGVGLASGTVLWLLSRAPATATATTATRLRLQPFVGPTGLGAIGSF